MKNKTFRLSQSIRIVRNIIATSLTILPLCIVASNSFAQNSGSNQPPLLLAKYFKNNIQLDNFFVSEKLDGIRAFWDGSELLTKNGNVIHAPDWFTDDFPRHSLDGELWIKRGAFEEVSGLARRKVPIDEEWKKIKFMVFDLPYDLATFDDRLVNLTRIVKETNLAHLLIVKQNNIQSKEDLDRYLSLVVAKGGEGLMLHKKDSLYQAIRSNDLQKLKPLYDAEATVIRHLEGKGKYLGYLGSIEVINEDGITFKIGSGFSFNERKNPPPIGSTITYQYRGKTRNNTPKFASFLRVFN
ncbi:MAG: DNA ligase [Kangiella sp.]|nr:MAG: DNA ligase [Kangiella sp.]